MSQFHLAKHRDFLGGGALLEQKKVQDGHQCFHKVELLRFYLDK